MWKFRISLIFCLQLMFGCEDTDGLIQPHEVDKWVTIRSSDGLVSSSIWSLFQDSDKNVWIGSFDNGLSIYDGFSFRGYSVSDGISDPSILSITELQDGTMVVGTYDGYSYLIDGQWYKVTAADIGAGDFVIYALLTDSNGSLWMSHAGYGFWINDGSWSYYPDNNCLQCNYINDFLEDSRGNIWSATDGGLKKHTSPTNYTLYTMSEGLHGNQVTALFEDNKGNIWIGYRDSEYVTKYDGSNFEPVFLYNDAFIDFNIEITEIAQDLEGNLWFGTLGLGVIKYDGVTFEAFFKDKGNLPSDLVTDIMVESNGDIWIGTFSGVHKYISR